MTLRSWLRRPIVVTPVALRPGDDLVLTVEDWPASEDIPSFLRALQQEFPGVNLHLLAGFGPVQVIREEHGTDGCAGPDKRRHQPRSAALDGSAAQVSPVPEPGPQGPVVVLRHAAGGRVIASTIPPQVQGDLVPPVVAHSHSSEGVLRTPCSGETGEAA